MPLDPPVTPVTTAPVGVDKTLNNCCRGETVTIHAINQNLSCAQRLRELGLVEGTSVLLLRQSDPLLVLVRDSRIAIDPKTARQIKVICNCVSESALTTGR